MFRSILLIAIVVSVAIAKPSATCSSKLELAGEEAKGLTESTKLCIRANPEVIKALKGNKKCQGEGEQSDECFNMKKPIVKCTLKKAGLLTASGEFDDAKFQKAALDRAGEFKAKMAEGFKECGKVKDLNIQKYDKCFSKHCK